MTGQAALNMPMKLMHAQPLGYREGPDLPGTSTPQARPKCMHSKKTGKNHILQLFAMHWDAWVIANLPQQSPTTR